MREICKKNYRIGLDIGITSVGWAVLENNEKDEPKKIIDLGVRIFEAAEQPKTGESLAAPRRLARTTRRRLRRRRHRLERIRKLLEKEGLIDIALFNKRYEENHLPNVYQLRYEALDRILDGYEFAQILIHIAKHRGFKSTRKAETEDKEGGAVLKATKENEQLMKDKGYRTVGEMLFKDKKFKTPAPWIKAVDKIEERYILTCRNKKENYQHTILRDLLEQEVHMIFEQQRKFTNGYASEEFEQQFLEIMLGQRSFDKGPGFPSPFGGNLIEKMVGRCTLEREEQRASKATYTAERFVLLQKLNNIKIIDQRGESRFLLKDEREILISYIYSKKSEVKFLDLRKKLKLPLECRFKELNYGKSDKEEVEKKTKFIFMKNYQDIKKHMHGMNFEKLTNENILLLDEVAQYLTLYKSDDNRREKLAQLGVCKDEIENLLVLNPSKFQHLSLKAMRKIIPFLEQGFIYNEACEKAGYDFQGKTDVDKLKLLKGEIIQETLNEIPNPVVKRALSQTIKVINAIIGKYGSPQAVHIELAREMSKNFQERKSIEKENKKNREKNEKIKQQIIELGHANPNGQDIIKFRLWQDQDGICLYSGARISQDKLFHPKEAEIDHIIPYSISFDDSYKNKVLVIAQCNQEKGNRIPFQYFEGREDSWHKFHILVDQYVKDQRKRDLLLKENFTEEDRRAFKERNLTDTKYITTVVYNLLRQYLQMEPYTSEGKKQQIFPVNGVVTAYLRKRWGLGVKDRGTDLHHAKDAVVVACTTPGMIHKISRSVQARELAMTAEIQFIDYETGEIIPRNEFTRGEWDEKFGVKIPYPWESFKNELEIRMAPNPEYFAKDLRKMGYSYLNDVDSVKPIFVSRMPRHKITGTSHAETIRSPKHFSLEGVVVSKTDLCNLKLDSEGEIENYYKKEDDTLLYRALQQHLVLFEGDGKKAFPQDFIFHKPKKDGTQGPIVKKVKVVEKRTNGIYVNHGNGIADNSTGGMVRIDVFRENGKHYFIPIYIADTVKTELPNKVAVGNHFPIRWKVMDDKNFLFSLYSRDLIEIRRSKPIPVTMYTGEKQMKEEAIRVYYGGADVSTFSISGFSHDKSFSFRSLGIQSLGYIKKYQVDLLGNTNEIMKEPRMKFK